MATQGGNEAAIPECDSKTISAVLAQARWIWGGEDPRPVNGFRLFRREFVLEQMVSLRSKGEHRRVIPSIKECRS